MPSKNVAIPRCRLKKTVLDWEKGRLAPSNIHISVDIYSNALKIWERTWHDPSCWLWARGNILSKKSVAKVAQSIETFKFKTATVINRAEGCVFAPWTEKRCINILKVRNLGKQYAHQIWSHTVQNPWRYAPEGCLFGFGFLAKSLISVCTLQCARAPDRRLLVQPNPNKAVLKRLQQRLELDQARFRVSARAKGAKNS